MEEEKNNNELQFFCALIQRVELYVFTQPVRHEKDVTQGQFLSWV